MISPTTRHKINELKREAVHLEELLACDRDFYGSLQRLEDFTAEVAQSIKADHQASRQTTPPTPGVFDLRKQLGRAPTAAEYNATRGR